jgi:hypothetical protein
MEETSMNYYTKEHRFYCGVDLHTRSMYLCVLDRSGQVLLHRNLPAQPQRFLDAIAPYRQDLVVCAKESAGKRQGTSGRKIGNRHLKWAFSEAAVLFLRKNPQGMKYKKRLQQRYGKSKALTILAHRLGRATYYVLKRQQAFEMKRFLSCSWDGAVKPTVSLAPTVKSPQRAGQGPKSL